MEVYLLLEGLKSLPTVGSRRQVTQHNYLRSDNAVFKN